MARSGTSGGRGGKGGGGAGGSSSASAGSIRAGKAFVELSTNDSPLDAGLKAASSKIQSWASSIAKVGVATMAAGAGILAPLIVSAEQFIEHGDKVKKASDRLGVSAESLSALGYAAAQSGTDIEGLEKGMRKLEQHVNDAASGNKEAYQSFADLGLIAQDLIDMKPDEMFLKVADAIASIENPSERTAQTIKAFGKSGAELIPLLLGGSKGVRQLMEEASLVGAVFTGEEAASAERIGDSLQRVWTGVKNILKSVGSAVVPLTDSIESLSYVVLGHVKTVRDWIEGNKLLVVSVAAVGVGLVTIGGMIIGAAKTISIVGGAIGVIGTVVGTVLSPLGLLTAAVVGGTAAWIAFSKTGADSVVQLGEQAKNAFNDIKSSWNAVTEALEAGDYALALKIAFAAINVAWLEMTKGMQTSWQSALGKMKEALIAWSFAAKDIYTRVTGVAAAAMAEVGEKTGIVPEGTAKNVHEDTNRELKRIQEEAVADSQKLATETNRAIEEAKGKLQAARDELDKLKLQARQANNFGGFEFPEPANNEYRTLGMATKAVGAFNIGTNSSSIFGGGNSVFGQQLEATKDLGVKLDEVRAAITGIPLAVIK